MGNNDTRPIKIRNEELGMKEIGAVFRQSLNDFPCPVTLGKTTPSFGLHRYKQGLRFVPPDDEGFTLRGDRQRLVYKGRRRSHRFTILDDGAFEYDCILNREPESNVISILMEGAEQFDFFRQPDFVKEPYLKESYAVYKKETLVGEGTGKLCHIHRPEIIDARGRRCWGELSVVGNELRITIPEWWLSEATYPVVVDPTIGTTTVGSQYLVEYDPPDDPWIDFCMECVIGTNRFLVSEAINGSCSAYIYTNEDTYGDAGGRAIVYSDVSNLPNLKISKQESFIDFEINGSKSKGWRSGTFMSDGSIASGSYIWFGVAAQFFWFPRFDYGFRSVDCYWDPWEEIPDLFPKGKYDMWEDTLKYSMYFTYTSAQNYIRTLTQGVTLSDSRKLTANYKRSLTQTADVDSFLGRNSSLFKKIQEAVQGLDNNSTLCLFSRALQENVTITELYRHYGAFFRGLLENVEVESRTKGGFAFFTYIVDTVHAAGVGFRGLVLVVRIVTGVFVRDYLISHFLKAKSELILKSLVCREIVLESKIH